MNKQFCKVGKANPNLKRFLRLEELQQLYKRFIEEAYNLTQTDSPTSDYLYFEASKLRHQMVYIEETKNDTFHRGF